MSQDYVRIRRESECEEFLEAANDVSARLRAKKTFKNLSMYTYTCYTDNSFFINRKEPQYVALRLPSQKLHNTRLLLLSVLMLHVRINRLLKVVANSS